jgi:hypothetical protein
MSGTRLWVHARNMRGNAPMYTRDSNAPMCTHTHTWFEYTPLLNVIQRVPLLRTMRPLVPTHATVFGGIQAEGRRRRHTTQDLCKGTMHCGPVYERISLSTGRLSAILVLIACSMSSVVNQAAAMCKVWCQVCALMAHVPV